MLDNAGRQMAAAGSPSAVAFAQVGLTDEARPVGDLRVSTTTAEQYVAQVHQLTGRELVLSRGGSVLASTVPPPSQSVPADQTAELSTGGKEYRGHAITLNQRDGETLLLLGPPKSGRLLGVGGAGSRDDDLVSWSAAAMPRLGAGADADAPPSSGSRSRPSPIR